VDANSIKIMYMRLKDEKEQKDKEQTVNKGPGPVAPASPALVTHQVSANGVTSSLAKPAEQVVETKEEDSAGPERHGNDNGAKVNGIMADRPKVSPV